MKSTFYILLLLFFSEKIIAQDSVSAKEDSITTQQIDSFAIQVVAKPDTQINPVVIRQEITSEIIHEPIPAITQEIKNDTFIYTMQYVLADSILRLLDTTRHTVPHQSSQSGSLLPEQPGKIIYRKPDSRPYWIFALFVLQLFVLIYLKVAYLKRMEEYVKAYFNLNLSQQLFREQEAVLSFQVLIMMFNFLLSCSLLIYVMVDYFLHPEYANPLLIFLQIFLAVAIIYAAKYFGYRTIEIIFPFTEEMNFFRFTYFMNQKLLGVVLIPFIYAAVYSEVGAAKFFLFASAGLFLFSIVIRSIKGLMIGAKFLRQNTFHFLLYICTFEIAPLIILMKWLQILAGGQS
jgi:hypothetical protein